MALSIGMTVNVFPSCGTVQSGIAQNDASVSEHATGT